MSEQVTKKEKSLLQRYLFAGITKRLSLLERSSLYTTNTGFLIAHATNVLIVAGTPSILGRMDWTIALIIAMASVIYEFSHFLISRERYFVARVIFNLSLMATITILTFYFGARFGFQYLFVCIITGTLMIWPQRRTAQLFFAGLAFVVFVALAMYSPGGVIHPAEHLAFVGVHLSHFNSALAFLITFIVFFLTILATERFHDYLIAETEARVREHEQNRLLDLRRTELEDLLQQRDDLIGRLTKMGRIAQSGALSATIAHEINQPLAAIRLNLEQLLTELRGGSDSARLQQLATRAHGGMLHMSDIVSTIRNIFKQREAAPLLVPFDPLVTGACALVQPQLVQHRIQLDLHLAAHAKARVAPNEMDHVVLNLIYNAIDSVRECPVEQRRIRVTTTFDGDIITMKVEDSGPGLGAVKPENLFELLQTSKQNGTGLGLWLSRYIVERHGGKIRVDTTRPVGLCFEVTLPGTRVSAREQGLAEADVALEGSGQQPPANKTT